MNTDRANAAVRLMGPVIFIIVTLLAVVSLIARWPHQFGGSGSKADIVGDFVTSGTATAPPLFILVIFGVVGFAVARRDRWGTAALVVLLLLSVLMAVGSIGEAVAPATPEVPRLAQLASGAFGGLAGAVLLALSVAALLERRRRRGLSGTVSGQSGPS